MKRNEHDERSESKKAPIEDERIGDLIRTTGRRPRLPAEELAVYRETARTAWRDAVRTERGRRLRARSLYALAASLLLALVGGWWWLAGRTALEAERIATVELLHGRVEAIAAADREPGGSRLIEVGDAVSMDVTLATDHAEGAAPARLALRMEQGQSVRLEAGTRVRFLSASRLELQRGALYVDSGPSVPAGADLEILTPLGVVREFGTQYEVRLAERPDFLRVRVREGSISVRHDGASLEAGRGEELTLRGDGTVARGTVEPDGPEWQWVLATTPALEIEGRSLDSFLEWVARETGWRIRYSDDALEQSARGIRLHGTIEGLRPDESLGVILEGSGLDYRSENGEIVVLRGELRTRR